VGTVFSGGLAAPAKVGVSVLKVAKKTKNISPSMLRHLSDALDEAVDLNQFKANLRNTNYTDVGKIKDAVVTLLNTAKTDKISAIFTDIKHINDSTSPIDAVKITKYADSPDDLSKLAKLSDDFKENTRGILSVLGKKALNISKYVMEKLISFIIMIASLVWSVLSFLFMAFTGVLFRAK